jgi:predicted Holliday junction resolvase-like endonuclease
MGCYDLTITLIYLSVLPTILTIILGIILFKFIKLSKQTAELHKQNKQSIDEINKSQLTSYELERLEREEQFDARITALKEELAKQQHIIRRGTIADELHPLVHNLPHDVIGDKHDLSSFIEVAE